MKMQTLFTILALALVCSLSYAAQKDEGLVAYYAFDEGSGSIAHDSSGNGNDGQIQGAKWVRLREGCALEFDGLDDYVDCGSDESLNIAEKFTVEAWVYFQGFPSSPTSIISKGHSYSLLATGYGGNFYWCGRQNSPLLIPGLWQHLVGTFDGEGLEIYLDGALITYSPSQKPAVNLSKSQPMLIGKGAGNEGYFKGMIDEVKIYSRALSADEVDAHYEEGHPVHNVPVKLYPYYFNQQVVAQIDPTAWGRLPAIAAMEVGLAKPGEKEILHRCRVELSPDGEPIEADLRVGQLAPGEYEARVTPVDRSGAPIGETYVARLDWPDRPSWPGAGKRVRVLNNFVTELLNVQGDGSQLGREYEFTNPREGWIFISSTANLVGTDKVRISLDTNPGEETLSVHKPGEEPTQEAMRFLPAGKYRLRVWAQGKSSLSKLIVRTIPELALVYLTPDSYPRFVPEHGPYDWQFLRDHHILDNLNVIGVGYRGKGMKAILDWARPYAREWKACGKRTLVERGLPGLDRKPTNVDEVYSHWTNAFEDPLIDGIAVDEFPGSGRPAYPLWTEAMRRMHDDEELRGKTLYAYTYAPIFPSQPVQTFFNTLVDCGYKIVWERYLSEPPTEIAARRFITASFKDRLLAAEQNVPNCTEHTQICQSIMTDPPLTTNTDAGVNYKVYLDMQFHHLANDPTFWGLDGFHPWILGQADEEILRWIPRLYRHYCIEGNTEMLSSDPYELTHIENPDFAQGLKGWTVSPAQEGSIDVKNIRGYNRVKGYWPEGRYDATQGDSFLWMKRSEEAPNTVRQQVKGLQPGRLYSLKMYTRDYQHPEVKQKLAVSIKLTPVELIPEKCFQHVFESRENAGWLNYHRLVFRAEDSEAILEISDWITENSNESFSDTSGEDYLGAPPGQEIMYNFVEILPYLED